MSTSRRIRTPRLMAAGAASMLSLWALAQAPTVLWGPVMDCNSEDEGTLRPRIALNGAGDPVVLWGDNAPMANHVAVGDDASFSSPIEVSTGFMPSVDDWMGSSIAGVGNTMWVVMKSAPEQNSPMYVRRSDDGGYTWGDTIRVDPFDGLVSRFPSIDVADPDAPLVQYMQFDSGFFGARQVVTHMMGGSFMAPVQVSAPFAPGDVCDCCPNQVVAYGGRAIALYRNAGSNVRVMWGAASSDGGASFPVGSVVDTTGWLLPACPSSGPDGYLFGDSVSYVWMSGANNGTKVYIGSASAVDLTLGEQMKVHPDQPTSLQQNFPRIAGSGDTLGVVWQQSFSGQSEILFSWSTSGIRGLSEPDTVNLDLMGAQKSPDIAYANGAFHIVWSEPGSGQVRYRKASLGTDVHVEQVNAQRKPFSVWPNPVHGSIDLPSDVVYVRVIDAEGRAVLPRMRASGSSLDVSALRSGQYTLELTRADESRITGRFIKQ